MWLVTTWLGRFVLFGLLAVIGGILLQNVDDQNNFFYGMYLTGAIGTAIQVVIFILYGLVINPIRKWLQNRK